MASLVAFLVTFFKSVPAFERGVRLFVSEWHKMEIGRAKDTLAGEREKRDETIKRLKEAQTEEEVLDALRNS